ncbi:MAG: HD domain-containing phosphohydrolase [Acidobacteriota bacterium]
MIASDMEEKGKIEKWFGKVPKYRILYSFLAVLIFVSLTPLATVAWKLVDINKEALKTFQQQYQLLLASSIAHKIDSAIDGYRERLSIIDDNLRSLIKKKLLHDLSPAALQQEIFPFLGGDFVMIRLMLPDGQNVTASVKEPYEGQNLITQEIEKTIAKSMSGDVAYWEEDFPIGSSIFRMPSGKIFFALSAPVSFSEMGIGYVSGLTDMENLWNNVLEESKKTGYTIFVLDSSGNLIAHSDPNKISEGANLRNLAIVKRFLETRGRSKETSAFIDNVNGELVRFLGSYEMTRNGWGIFIKVEEKKAYSLIGEIIKSTFIWSLGVILLAIIVGVVFAGGISRPINLLASSSQKFANGEFSVRAQVRTRNEIGQLAATFNYMAEELQRYIDKLKEALNENNQLFLGTIRVLANAIDEKDPYTRGHSVRVNKYSVVIAKYMGLSADDIRDIHVASLLHDVGKIGIDDAILRKPSILTGDEYDLMKQHTVKGANIMLPIKYMEKIIPAMKYHHEKYGGGGYPEDLKGEEIPLTARIIHVADTFDAMTTDRPYQKAVTFDDAVARLNEMKEWDCDPKVVEAFNRAYQNNEFKLEAESSKPSSY